MFSHTTRVCKVYIHDLDVKSERRVRQKILMSGATHATRVRFDGDVNNADIWILNDGSAFKGVALKRQSAGKFVLWISKEGDLHTAADTGNSLLVPENIAKAVDAVVTGRKISINKDTSTSLKEKAVNKSQPKPTSKIANLIKNGADSHKGSVCLKLNQAQLLFDFSNSIVHYNDAGKSLLWDEFVTDSCLDNFEVTDSLPSGSSFAHSCSMFSAIWQLCHRDASGSLIEPLDRNSVLELQSWPTFELVEHDYDHCRIASFLQKRSLSADQVIKLMKLDNEMVTRFFNAIYLSSYARCNEASTGMTIAEPAAAATGGLTSLWKKVRGAMQFRK